jgi:ankyrin repeat protein
MRSLLPYELQEKAFWALVRAGAEVSAAAVCAAARSHLPGLLETVLAMGSDANARFSDQTALSRAARMGRVENLGMLIRHGADVNARSSGGRTALHGACAFGSLEGFPVLFAGGADVGVRGDEG